MMLIVLHQSKYAAVTVAFLVSVVNGYVWNQALDFQSRPRQRLFTRSLSQFLLVNTVSLGAWTWLFVRLISVPLRTQPASFHVTHLVYDCRHQSGPACRHRRPRSSGTSSPTASGPSSIRSPSSPFQCLGEYFVSARTPVREALQTALGALCVLTRGSGPSALYALLLYCPAP